MAKKTISIPAPNVSKIAVHIRGLSPLMQNRWRQSAIDAMRAKQEKQAKVKKEARDPEAEVAEILAAATISENGKVKYGHPSEAIVEAVASAGHRLGDWTNKGPTIKGAIRVDGELIPISGSDPVVDTRPGRIKGTWTVAHRPKYREWEMTFDCEIDVGVISVEEFLNLLMLAGRGVGIGSYRVERGGPYGRFEVVSAEIE
jgi:hypothetical protein